MPRLMVTLQLSEREALLRLARREKRDPRAQAALIIRRELERAGLLVPEKPDKLVHSDHQAAAATEPIMASDVHRRLAELLDAIAEYGEGLRDLDEK